MTEHRQWFGDAERVFKLTPAMIGELERVCGAGIGSICNRVFTRTFAHRDVSETVRLALVGGGTAPEEAAALVAAYVADRPLAEGYSLAVDILQNLWSGSHPAAVQPVAPGAGE